MVDRLTLVIVAVMLATAAAAEEDCPKHFRDYGLFLQAKKSCVREDEYPSMKLMRTCAKQTPKETALKLMDDGRREWARGVMRTNLGSMCGQVFVDKQAVPEHRKRR